MPSEDAVRLKGSVDGVALKPGLLVEGRRIPVSRRLVIGSGEESDLRLSPAIASASHAAVTADSGGLFVEDLSGIGVLVNDSLLQGARAPLETGDRITIGGVRIFVTDGTEGLSQSLDSSFGATLAIGSSPDCDVYLSHPRVSPLAAVIEEKQGGFFIRDHSPGAGLLVNGTPCRLSPLQIGDEVVVGPFRLIFDGHSVIRSSSVGATLETTDLSKNVEDKTILQPTNLSVLPGEMIAIIGGSGTGKSTLLRLLAGADLPEAGLITLGGDPLAVRSSEIGYVPQDEIVHGKLTVLEALTYAARLRLPQDTTEKQLSEAVWTILEELSLEDHLETRVEHLSGGQRKRVGLASELVHRPSVLLLDEPTSGLDPALERRTMELFRRLAQGERSVIVVTHATASLEMADKVLVLGRGGYTTYFGHPQGAREFFGVGSFDEIFGSLHDHGPEVWNEKFRGSEDHRRQEVGARLASQGHEETPPKVNRRLNPLTELALLTGRYARVFARDSRNLLLLGLQAPFLGLLATVIGDFSPDKGPTEVANSVFILVTISIWLGAITAAREISKERAQLARELAVGVRASSYLLSKLLLLGGVASTLVLTMGLTATIIDPLDSAAGLPSKGEMTASLLACLVLVGIASVTLGLAVSAFAKNQAQANSLLPLVLIPQLLFGGALKGLKDASLPLQILSDLTISRWGFAGSGTAIDMSQRIADSSQLFKSQQDWGQFSRGTSNFFDVSLPELALIMAVFTSVLLVASYLSIVFREGAGSQPQVNE